MPNTNMNAYSDAHPPESCAIDPAILYWGTPVVLISTLNPDGTANLAPMSSVWWLGQGCMLGMTESAQTVVNLRRTGECVLNLPSEDMATAVDRIARTTGRFPVPPDKRVLDFEHEAQKFERANLKPLASAQVSPPRVAECPVQMEATVERISSYGETNPSVRTEIAAIELRVLQVHSHPSILLNGDRRRVDPDLWRPLIMSFREFYGLGSKLRPSRLAETPEDRWRPQPIPGKA